MGNKKGQSHDWPEQNEKIKITESPATPRTIHALPHPGLL